MRRLRHLSLCAVLALAATGCTGDSALPEPTGKGTVRAINAAKGSPSINFLIDERPLESVVYKTASQGRQWDDFEYNFNFEAVLVLHEAAEVGHIRCRKPGVWPEQRSVFHQRNLRRNSNESKPPAKKNGAESARGRKPRSPSRPYSQRGARTTL